MRDMWRALGPVVQESKWILPLLGVAASVATFALAGPIIGLCFIVILLLLFLFVAFRFIATSATIGAHASDRGEGVGRDVSLPRSNERDGEFAESDTATSEADEDSSISPAGAAPTNADIDSAVEEESLDRSAFDAAFRGDVEAVRESFERAVASLTEETEINRTKAFYNFLLVKAGDADALAKLSELVQAKAPPLKRILFAYASALDVLGESNQAIQTLLSLSESFSSDEQAEARLQAAQIHRRLNNNQGVIDLLEPLAGDEQVASAHRAEAWNQIARCKSDSSPLEAMAAYEKSMQLNPSNADARFSLAYLYSNHNFATLAHYHYSVLEETHAATSVALNNLGVSEEQLGMLGRAIAHFEAAAEAGAALACANLAHNLLNAGHVLEARRWIGRGEEIDPNQPRLISARGRLSDMIKDEEEALKSTQRTAVAMRTAVVSALKANTEASSIEGPWRLSNDVIVTFNGTADLYEGADESKDWRLRLTPNGSVFAAAIRPSKYAGEVEGYMYMSSPNKMTFVLPDVAHEKLPESLTATRTSEINEHYEASTEVASERG